MHVLEDNKIQEINPPPLANLDVKGEKKDGWELKEDFSLKCAQCGELYTVSFQHNYFCLNAACPSLCPGMDIPREIAKILKLVLSMVLTVNWRIATETEQRIYSNSPNYIDDLMKNQIGSILDILAAHTQALTKIQNEQSKRTDVTPNARRPHK